MNVLKYFKRLFTLNSFKEYNFTISWSVIVLNELHEHMNATCKICKMCFINHEKKIEPVWQKVLHKCHYHLVRNIKPQI